MGRRLAVRVLAWAMRHGVTIEQAAAAVDRSFKWRPVTWRDQLMLDAVASNRERTMKAIGA